MVYIVSFVPANHMIDCIGGVWGAYSSWKKAEQAVQRYVEMYQETIYTCKLQPNGLYVYRTNKGCYVVEEIEIDTIE